VRPVAGAIDTRLGVILQGKVSALIDAADASLPQLESTLEALLGRVPTLDLRDTAKMPPPDELGPIVHTALGLRSLFIMHLGEAPPVHVRSMLADLLEGQRLQLIGLCAGNASIELRELFFICMPACKALELHRPLAGWRVEGQA
jgi:hypothetical protein